MGQSWGPQSWGVVTQSALDLAAKNGHAVFSDFEAESLQARHTWALLRQLAITGRASPAVVLQMDRRGISSLWSSAPRGGDALAALLVALPEPLFRIIVRKAYLVAAHEICEIDYGSGDY